jgi:hypothetical protein
MPVEKPIWVHFAIVFYIKPPERYSGSPINFYYENETLAAGTGL